MSLTVEQRIEIERKVVTALIRVAKAHGYTLKRVWDGETYEYLDNEKDALEVVFSVDESRMSFKHPDEDKAHCAVIILGNDGWDAIADHSTGGKWDAVMEELDTWLDEQQEQQQD